MAGVHPTWPPAKLLHGPQSLRRRRWLRSTTLRRGEFEAAGELYWADSVTSIDPSDLADAYPAQATNIAAVRGKARFRIGEGRIDEIGIDGPFITGDQFALFLDMLIIDADSGHARPFTEIAIFTVRDGQIVEERFFYD